MWVLEECTLGRERWVRVVDGHEEHGMQRLRCDVRAVGVMNCEAGWTIGSCVISQGSRTSQRRSGAASWTSWSRVPWAPRMCVIWCDGAVTYAP